MILLSTVSVFGQTVKKCYVYQYYESDTSNKTLVLIKNYYPSGKLDSEVYTGYKNHRIESGNTNSVFYKYRDTLLIEMKTAEINGDSSKHVLTYDSNNLLIKKEQFLYKLHLKEGYTKNGCITPDNYYEQEKRWKTELIVFYNYDLNNKLTQQLQSGEYFGYEIIKTYKYEDSGQLSSITTFHDSIIYTIDYYKYDGQKCLITTEGWNRGSKSGYNSIEYFVEISFDNLGRTIVSKQTFPVFPNSESVDKYYFSSEKLIRHVHQNKDEFLGVKTDEAINHVYVYEYF